MRNIFISSTFNDMHYERDILLDYVQPEINQKCREYGESVSMVDLRWGVNTMGLSEIEQAKKVLSVCLDQIDKCRPYMVVLIGERYGWIPENDLMMNTIKEKRDFHLRELETSVTELEIEYGALSNKQQLVNTLFYFREIDGNYPESYKEKDQNARQKLENLKKRIEKLSILPVRNYKIRWDSESDQPSKDSLMEFAHQVSQDLISIMEDSWKRWKEVSPFKREAFNHINIANENNQRCYQRKDLLENCMREANGPTKVVHFIGPSGSGKTMLMSNLHTYFQQNGATVLPIFCGNTKNSLEGAQIFAHILRFFESMLLDPNKQEPIHLPDDLMRLQEEHSEYFESLAKQLTLQRTRGMKIIILIDGLDKLPWNYNMMDLTFIARQAGDAVTYVVSSSEDFHMRYALGYKKMLIPALTKQEMKSIIDITLKSKGRELEESIIQTMLQKKSASNPLYLSLLIQMLLIMNQKDFMDIQKSGDGMDSINTHIIKLVQDAPDEIDELTNYLMEKMLRRVAGDFGHRIMKYLAVSKNGFTKQVLQDICAFQGIPWNEVEFALVEKYFSLYLCVQFEGEYDYRHTVMKKGICNQMPDYKEMNVELVNCIEFVRGVHKKEYEKENYSDLPYRYWERILDSESLTYYSRAGNMEKLANYINQGRYFANSVIDVYNENGQQLLAAMRIALQTELNSSFYRQFVNRISVSFLQERIPDREKLVYLYQEVCGMLEEYYQTGKAGVHNLFLICGCMYQYALFITEYFPEKWNEKHPARERYQQMIHLIRAVDRVKDSEESFNYFYYEYEDCLSGTFYYPKLCFETAMLSLQLGDASLEQEAEKYMMNLLKRYEDLHQERGEDSGYEGVLTIMYQGAGIYCYHKMARDHGYNDYQINNQRLQLLKQSHFYLEKSLSYAQYGKKGTEGMDIQLKEDLASVRKNIQISANYQNGVSLPSYSDGGFLVQQRKQHRDQLREIVQANGEEANVQAYIQAEEKLVRAIFVENAMSEYQTAIASCDSALQILEQMEKNDQNLRQFYHFHILKMCFLRRNNTVMNTYDHMHYLQQVTSIFAPDQLSQIENHLFQNSLQKEVVIEKEFLLRFFHQVVGVFIEYRYDFLEPVAKAYAQNAVYIVDSITPDEEHLGIKLVRIFAYIDLAVVYLLMEGKPYFQSSYKYLIAARNLLGQLSKQDQDMESFYIERLRCLCFLFSHPMTPWKERNKIFDEINPLARYVHDRFPGALPQERYEALIQLESLSKVQRYIVHRQIKKTESFRDIQY